MAGNDDSLPPIVQHFSPAAEYIIPPHNTTADQWVIGNVTAGNNTMFRTQWIQCCYPISSTYGPRQRYIFYVLAIFTVLMRRSAWIGTAALGSVMVYSTTAAVHAIILVTLRTRLVPADLSDNIFILVESNTIFGLDDDALWLPILPMA